ncbi:MAG: trypsin-like peptidase domain-containing protein [Firmicutes bacterium]|nr:trypsin-like peptidase domain-containing protein [Bacillota bacterium]MBE3590872.1 trypsin-like peptidase domain-containing protein [Bacillota bacterium]
MDPWSETNIRALETARASLVHISAKDPKDGSVALGSATVIDHYHVVASAQFGDDTDEITVTTFDGRKRKARPLATDPLYFIAVLRVEGRIEADLPALADLAELVPGRLVLSLGDPFGYGPTVSMGVIGAADRTIYRPERIPVDGLIVTDAVIHPGNMGGPLITLDGRVAGVNGIAWGQGLGLAVQAETIWRVANQIIEYGEATHPWLGFGGEPEVIDQALVRLFDLPVDRGVVVAYVASEGPGRDAGVEPLDLVVGVDGLSVASLGAIRRALARRRPGERAKLTVLRGGELIDLDIRVENMPRLTKSEN